jgi:hypothetical protein
MSLADELAKLEELRRSGSLSDAEFTKATATVLSGAPAASGNDVAEQLADQLAEVKYQNELAQIDREWQIERQQYLIRTQYGMAQVPTAGMGIGTAVVAGVFGTIWTIFSISLTSGGPDFGAFSVAKVIFPLFGVAFTVAGIGYGIYTYNRAHHYQDAFARYQLRRERARAEPAASARPKDHRDSSHDIEPA